MSCASYDRASQTIDTPRRGLSSASSGIESFVRSRAIVAIEIKGVVMVEVRKEKDFT